MLNVQGKNVVIVGGLSGVGLALTKTLLNKRVNKLYIIDVTENHNLIQELRSQYQSTKIDYERIDYWNFRASQIQHAIQNVVVKAQHIDVVINALEIAMEKDLQRTIDTNLKHYLNATILWRNAMDRNKGGRGGVIVNVLNNLGLQTTESRYDAQQYLINKQILLSLNKALSDDFFYQQTGVAVLSVLPVINQRALFKNMDWIKEIGLQHLVIDINSIHGQGHGQNTHRGHHDHQDYTDLDFLGNYNDQEDYSTWQSIGIDQDDYTTETYGQRHHDWTYGQRNSGNIRKFLDSLSFNIIRVIERSQNGQVYVVGLEGAKNIHQTGHLSHL